MEKASFVYVDLSDVSEQLMPSVGSTVSLQVLPPSNVRAGVKHPAYFAK